MKLQQEYCRKNGLPFFAPPDGKCYSCGNIVEDDGTKLLTGCPHCNISWCE